jgi:transposase-like protein
MSDTTFNSVLDLIKVFPDEKACHQYLAARRWETGVIVCPHCSHEEAYVFSDGIRYKCKKCNLKYTAKTGTFMDSSKLATIKWIYAMYLVLHKKGISSIQLGKDLEVTQKTAWFMLQRIRTALGNEPEDMLEGTIEIDEAFVGGKARFKHKNKRPKYNPGREFPDKTPVVGMMQRSVKNSRGDIIPARVRAFPISNVTMLEITKAVRTHVKIGSHIMGDGFAGYRVLQKTFNVSCVDHSKGWYVDGIAHTNTIEGFWSQFKKGICATYHKTTPKHLSKYVNEFAFKYNYKHLSLQGQIDTIITNMVIRLKYKELTAQ